jgi:aerobic-type carbon monoxide dehydrogenase small subunit (CoxS/CutS family)
MSEEKEIKKDRAGITRRKFLKDAGIVVGGTAIGSAFFLSACGEKVEVTKTVTTTAPGATITTTAPGTPGGTATETKTVTKYICPVCSQEFDTLDALKAHFDSAHEKEAVVQDGVINITVNGQSHEIRVKPHWTLDYVLREVFGLTGVKRGCELGACGVCTVLMNDRPCLACLTLAIECGSKRIETIEGLAEDALNLHPIQQAFYEEFGAQCGYCSPGIVMRTKYLLSKTSSPTVSDIRASLSGNICKCGNYSNIIKSVQLAANKVKGG